MKKIVAILFIAICFQPIMKAPVGESVAFGDIPTEEADTPPASQPPAEDDSELCRMLKAAGKPCTVDGANGAIITVDEESLPPDGIVAGKIRIQSADGSAQEMDQADFFEEARKYMVDFNVENYWTGMIRDDANNIEGRRLIITARPGGAGTLLIKKENGSYEFAPALYKKLERFDYDPTAEIATAQSRDGTIQTMHPGKIAGITCLGFGSSGGLLFNPRCSLFDATNEVVPIAIP